MPASLIRGTAVVTGGRPPRRASVLIAGRKILAVGRAADKGARRAGARRVDLDGGWLAPGFLDLHTHGAVGVDFVTADRAGIVRAMEHFAAHGVGGLLLSIYPAPLAEAVETLER